MKKGDKLICVDNSGKPWLKIGAIYTFEKYKEDVFTKSYLLIKEKPGVSLWTDRFNLLVDEKDFNEGLLFPKEKGVEKQ